MIVANNLHFKQGNFVIEDLSLSFPKGEVTGIVGPNGSGKSTLLKLISRLLQQDSGAIYIDDRDLLSYKRKELARKMAMLVQLKEAMPSFTVREMVSYGRTPYQNVISGKTDEDQQIIEWAMKETGLTQLEDRLVHSLSGGEQQRVRIAMALAQKTNILLLDEPTTYLDIGHQVELMALLKRINRELGITIIMVLHELQYAAAYCHHMIVMKQGKAFTSGIPSEVLTEDLLKQVYEIEAKIIYDGNYPSIIPKQY
ncbi:ABC transporter ATP-binding protein [Cytobacillus horneckiae]|uniref:ABC transporter ATP-binding protein n=1 Tax=Cytobacillus horneckiae TaxID=549687 RepID=UPI0039A22D40